MSGSGTLSRVAIVGASSLRGKELKQVLEDRSFPATDIVLLDESVMAGTLTEAGGEPTFIRALEEDSFDGVRFAFLAGSQLDAEQSWRAAQRAGATVIDMTGAVAASGSAEIRIPSIAATLPAPARKDGGATDLYYSPPTPVIIAATIVAAFRKFDTRRIALTLFPPVSERDQSGVEELEGQTANLLSFRPIEQAVFDAQVAFNLLTAYGAESKLDLADVRNGIARDVAQYLGDRAPLPAIQLVQAPVFYGYAFTAYAEFGSVHEMEQLEPSFSNLGVKVSDSSAGPPTNVSVAGENEIQMARIEGDPNVAAGVWLWGVADNLRLSTTNAVRIAEGLVGKTTN